MKLTALLTGASIALLSLPAEAETLYLTAGKFVDPVTAETVNRPVFVIEDGVITARGTANKLRKPSGSTSIDLKNATLVPGFIDMHTHLTSDPEDPAYFSLSFSDERQAITGVKNARKTLLAGFTTVRNVGASSYSDVALRDAMKAMSPAHACTSPGLRLAFWADIARTPISCHPSMISQARMLPQALGKCGKKFAGTSNTAST